MGEFKNARDLLWAHFGHDQGEFLLWEATCWPLDGEYSLEQAEELVGIHQREGDDGISRHLERVYAEMARLSDDGIP